MRIKNKILKIIAWIVSGFLIIGVLDVIRSLKYNPSNVYEFDMLVSILFIPIFFVSLIIVFYKRSRKKKQ